MAEINCELNLTFDLGNLAAYDINTIDATTDLDQLTLSNTQALISKLIAQDKEETEEAVFIKLPAPILQLPREQAPPQPKTMTKWEKFRVQKGLGRRRKRSRMVYEPLVNDWVPRWGPYSSKKIQKKHQFATEVKDE